MNRSGVDQEGSTASTTDQQESPSRRLLHYSSKPIRRVKSVPQTPDVARGRYNKPVGLWVSVEGEDDWRSWCEAESFGNPSAQTCYEITLSDSARILRLTSGGDILSFTREYGFDPFMGPMAGRTIMATHGIRWDRVAELYQGIIIAPYVWPMRLSDSANWYYGWDCASGCIWDARAIAAIRPERASVLAVDFSRSSPAAAVDTSLTSSVPFSNTGSGQ